MNTIQGGLCALAFAGPASGDLIRPECTIIDALPGTEVRVLWLLQDASVPLFGYSLDLNLEGAGLRPDGSSFQDGAVSVNAAATNFFKKRNLIVAGGSTLDPTFSVIESDMAGGVFVSTNTADLSTVTPVPGINDVLAEVVFTVSEAASGDFVFELGAGTALSDGLGFPVPFTTESITIHVVPSPGGAAFCFSSLLLVSSRKRR